MPQHQHGLKHLPFSVIQQPWHVWPSVLHAAFAASEVFQEPGVSLLCQFASTPMFTFYNNIELYSIKCSNFANMFDQLVLQLQPSMIKNLKIHTICHFNLHLAF